MCESATQSRMKFCIVSLPSRHKRHVGSDITKLEAVQRRSARWATRDYQRTSSVTQMVKGLNWRTLEQRRIDSRLILMYKITYDLVAIPAADYLIPNTRQSRHNHQLSFRQIPNTQRLLQVHILSPHHGPLERLPFTCILFFKLFTSLRPR